jgi:hypothetical protein
MRRWSRWQPCASKPMSQAARQGVRPFLLGLIAFFFISGFSLLLIRMI